MIEPFGVWPSSFCRTLLSPCAIKETLPLTLSAHNMIFQARQETIQIVSGEDDRLLVIVGPCSIHDTKAALEYAQNLQKAMQTYKKQLSIVMRVYLEKPRTTTGWKGLINDPYLNGSHEINDGLLLARRLLSDLTSLGVPAATEFIDVFSPVYIGDFITWGAIGARSSEARLYRELASGLPMAVGFKNNTGGNVQVAIDAVETAAHAHSFFSITETGQATIVRSRGNPNTHVVLRGSRCRTNYDTIDIERTVSRLSKKQLLPRVMIDCSHGNSTKKHLQQQQVAFSVAQAVASNNTSIIGVMLESFLIAGRQDLQFDTSLQYGQSVTDACLSWDQTLNLLDVLANSVEQRRRMNAAQTLCFDPPLARMPETQF